MREIVLTRNQTTKVDDEDFDRLNKFKWSAVFTKTGNYYAAAKINGKSIQMQKYIMGNNGALRVDHVDRDGLNNQKYNLRFVNSSENGINTKINKRNKSGCVGVHYDKIWKKYISAIRINRNRVLLGAFVKIEDAINARKIAESKYFPDLVVVERAAEIKIKEPITHPNMKRFSGGISGMKGIFKQGRKWFGRIKVDGKYHYSGTKNTIEEAKAEYDKLIKNLNLKL